MTLSAEFLRFRKRRPCNQVQLAQSLGVSRRTIQHIEGNPKHVPLASTIAKFRALKRKFELEAQ